MTTFLIRFDSRQNVSIFDGMVHIILQDTAGSERYATMSRMYYRRARAAIVCYSILDRETYERARDWISELLATEEVNIIY